MYSIRDLEAAAALTTTSSTTPSYNNGQYDPTASSSSSSTSTTSTPTGVANTSTTSSDTTTATTSSSSDTLSSSTTAYSGAISSTNVASITSSSVIPTHTNGTVTHVSSASHISTGALAGGIVGAFAGGCILAFILAFLLLRKRKHSQYPPAKDEDSGVISSVAPKGATQRVSQVGGASLAASQAGKPSYLKSLAAGAGTFDLAPFIAEAADDSTVSTRVQTLFDQVSLHVDNYYSTSGQQRRLTPEAVAQINQYDSGVFDTSLPTVLSNSRPQRPILTHTLLYAIMRAIQPQAQGSLLPACYRLGPEANGRDTLDTDDRSVFAWRMLTSHIYASKYSAIPAQLEAQNDSITRFANAFTEAFTPYSDPQFNEADRLVHLTSVCRAAAELGVWLFSQPCFFELGWLTSSSSSKIIVFPHFTKTCDEQGTPLAVPQTLLQPVTRQV
ncbi:hypothetical protein N7454_010728 [Penicillium verhagenii]|nr:hypothetical protein N7454_010728 [Penicillium verhagenii]